MSNMEATNLLKRIEFRTLMYFLAVCHHRNLTVAAERLGVAKSVLSEACTQMETTFGITLFRRDYQGIYPNKQGLHIAEYALYVQNLEQFAKRIAGLPVEDLGVISFKLPFKISGLETNDFLNQALEECASQFPNVLVWPENLSPSPVDDANDDYAAEVHGIEYAWRPTWTELGQCHLHIFTGDVPTDFEQMVVEPWYVLFPKAMERGLPPKCDLTSLKRKKVLIPRMPWPLLQPITQWCLDNGLHFEQSAFELLDCHAKHFAANEVLLVNGFLLSNQLSDEWHCIKLNEPLQATLAMKTLGQHPAVEALRNAIQSTWMQKKNLQPTIWQPITSLKQWRYFAATIEKGSISSAAQGLFLSQPALSMQLKNFEASLNQTHLIDRKTGVRHLTVTAAGEVIQQLGFGLTDLLNIINQYCQYQSFQQSQLLILGMLPTFDEQSRLLDLIVNRVGHWLKQYPKVKLEIVEERHQMLMHMLRNQTLHLALTETDSTWVKQVPLLEPEEMGLVIHEKLIDSKVGHVMDWEDVRRYPLILTRSGSGLRVLIDNHCLGLGVTLQPTLESDSFNVNRAWVIRGLYATILPKSAMASSFDRHPLRFIPLKPSLNRVLRVAYLGNRFLTPLEEDLIQFLSQ